MKRLLLALLAIATTACANAQLLSWTPPFPTEADAAQNLVITMDATLGNQGLKDYTPPTDVYVHIGVITNLSSGPTNWLHSPFTWATTPVAARATYLNNNKWSYTFAGSLRTFFNITDPNEHILKIAILFRNGTGTKVQRNSDASDMYVPVYTSGAFNVRLDKPNRQPNYAMTADATNWVVGTNFNVQGSASAASAMKLYHNGTQIATNTGVTTLSGSSTVTSFGQQTIVVEANNGTSTIFDTIKIFVGPAASPVVALPAGVRDGINYGSDPTKVTLVLRAPNKTKATVIGDFNNWLEDLNYVMNKSTDGKFFWITLTGLTAGAQYGFQYKVDDSLRVADPYSELVLDPYNDQYIPAATYPGMKPYPTGLTTGVVGVFQTAAPTYNFASTSYTRPNKGNLIVYEMILRDFVAAHDWKTVQDTLNYLKTLGVNAIELMPVNEFEGNLSWGYNPDFYFSPDKYYGPANDMRRFVDSCHARGIAVVMDVALNHSFGMSPMVQLYWDPANSRPASNNPWFNAVPKHAFNVGYDMNHESADTRYFTSRVMDFWTNSYKIDGFRFDLSKGFTQVQTCDNNGGNCNVGSWGNYDASRVNIWKAYYDSLQLHAPGSYAILEHFADNTEEKELANYGLMLWGNMSGNYQQASMGYATTNASLDYGLFTVRGWNNPNLVTYAESHDEERLMYKDVNFGNSSGAYNIHDVNTALKRQELVGAFLFTIPGPKMMYEFQELGYDFSINYCSNGSINTNCRTDAKPIHWEYLANANRKHVYDVWSKIINLRYHPWFAANFTSNRIARQLDGNFRWFQVTTDTSNLCVVGNFDVAQQTGNVTFQNAGTWYDLIEGTTFTATGSAQSITLAPGEYHVYVNRNVNATGTTPVQNLATTGNTLDAGVYPNPVRNQFNVDMYLPAAGTVSFEILGANGQVLRNLRQAFLSRGRQLLSFDRAGLPAGAYYLRVAAKSGTRILPMILQ
jgi:glycosidase